MSNNYKAQYKTGANQQWQVNQSGSEQGCMAAYLRLKTRYPFARVVDPDGRVVT